MAVCYKSILPFPLMPTLFWRCTYPCHFKRIYFFLSHHCTEFRHLQLPQFILSVPLLMDIQVLCYPHQQVGGHCVLPCESFCRVCVPTEWQCGDTGSCSLPFSKLMKCSLKQLYRFSHSSAFLFLHIFASTWCYQTF